MCGRSARNTRRRFPDWTVTKTTEEYVTAALRLIENVEERRTLSAALAGPQAIEKLIFKGRPEILGERMQELWEAKLQPAKEKQTAAATPTAKVKTKSKAGKS